MLHLTLMITLGDIALYPNGAVLLYRKQAVLKQDFDLLYVCSSKGPCMRQSLVQNCSALDSELQQINLPLYF